MLGIDKTLHCPGHNTVYNRVHNLLAKVGISGQNESRVKNNVTYLEEKIVGGRWLEIRC